MRKLLLVVIALVLVLAPAAVLAQDSKDKKEKPQIVTLSANEVVDTDYFAAGEIVEISGTVNGDVYAAGGQVIVDGVVNGDLLVAGGMVSISGEVTQDVRAAGGQISVSGKVGRNLTLAGGQADVINTADIAGNVVIAAGNANLANPIKGNVKAGAGNLVISNTVDGSVDAAVGSLRLTSNAQIDGNLVYISEEDASIDSNAVVTGEVTKRDVPEEFAAARKEFVKEDESAKGIFSGFKLFSTIISFASTLVLGLILIRFCPKHIESTTEIVKKRPLASFGFGFLTIILVPIVTILLLISVLGLPLGFMLIMAFIVYGYVSRIYAMVAIGKAVGRNVTQTTWVFLIGLVIYYVISLLPILGGIIKALIVLTGLGAAVLNDRNTYFTKAHK